MKIRVQIFAFGWIMIMFISCREQALIDTSTDEFILQEGFEIELLAAEPLLDSPVALSFDEMGRIWVVELTGYMRDIDGSDEQVPDGNIVMLTDADDDGIMDTRHVVIDSLEAPRTLLHVYGGLLYSHGKSLYWTALDDAQVGVSVLVDSLYVVGGNIEHQPNNLIYHLDNWIYSANSRSKYRYSNGSWLLEPTSFRGQWGISHDVEGRMHYNNNSLALAIDYTMPGQMIQNPFQKIKYNHTQAIATTNRIYPYQATAVNRGYQDGVLDEEGKVTTFTSACAPLVYTGDQLGTDFYQDVLVCGPEANLIKRYTIEEIGDNKRAVPVYDQSEFLISTDETFRPVNLYNAPDGSLYVVDMRKGVIQHRAYMTSYLREKILEKGLDKINGRGRIYRVTKTNAKNFGQPFEQNIDGLELVNLLSSPSAYDRKFAQQQIIFQSRVDLAKEIVDIAENEENPHGQLHALWTLEGMGLLDNEIWKRTADKSSEPIVIETLIRLAELAHISENELLEFCRSKFTLGNTQINKQMAVRLGQMKHPGSFDLLLSLAKRYGNDYRMSEAIISGISGGEAKLLENLKMFPGVDTLKILLKTTISNKDANEVQAPQSPKGFFKDNRTAGFDLYNLHCASCHSLDGKGKDNLAPPLLESEYVSGSKDRLILLTLHGLHGPVTVNGTIYDMNAVMPGVINNPNLSNKDIADILVFLRNSFSFSDTRVSEADVKKWRESMQERSAPFTEEELSKF